MKRIFDLLAAYAPRLRLVPCFVLGLVIGPMVAAQAQGALPPNDNFANRILLSGTAVITNGYNTNATREAGEPLHGGRVGNTSVWWSWVAPFSGRVTLSTFGSSFDTLLGVYTGSAVSSLTTIASNDDASPTNYTSQVTFDCVAGTTYQIAVDGFIDETGSISLNLVLRPVLNLTKSGNNVVLSWTAASSGYNLESSPTLVSPVWSSVSPAPVVVSGQNRVTNTIAGAMKFYRLKKP